MNKEIMKGAIDILILSILKNQDNYGYEIARVIKDDSHNTYIISEGTLYTALKRLESNNLIESYWNESLSAPKRKYYTITENGCKVLNEKWIEWDQIVRLMNIYRRDI